MLMMSLGEPAYWLRMWCTRRVSAHMGQVMVLDVSWLMMLLQAPFFWLVMRMVALVAVERVERSAVLGMMVWSAAKKVTSHTLNCCVRRRSLRRWLVYSPTCSR